MAKEAKPKIPLKEIHEILSIQMDDFDYMIIAIDKEDMNHPNPDHQAHVNVASSFRREDAKQILGDILDGLENETAYEAHATKDEAFKQGDPFKDKSKWQKRK